MKNKFDPRHLKRIANVQALFAWSCGNNEPHTEDSQKIIKKIPKIDQIITQNAPKWPLDKINKVDLNILRYAFWELFYFKKNPEKVVIDEAIEIAKAMLLDGDSIEKISKITSLTVKEIEKLK